MPLYNKEAEVDRAVRSVLSQTVSDFELVIVNDGSTDKGPQVVRAIEDQRIRIVDQTNQGVSAARNRGIEEASAELIAFLDADDEWAPDFLETIAGLKSKYPSCDVFGTGYFLSPLTGQRRPAIIRGIPHDMKDGILANYFTIAAKSDPPLWTSAVAVTKKAMATVGGFPVGVTSGEDLLTWARLATKFQIAYSVSPCSVHYNPQKVSDRPDRLPQQPDVVGHALRELFRNADPATIPGLKVYIALWHRMRAVVFIQLGDRVRSCKEITAAMKCAPSLKLLLLFLIANLPGSFSSRALISLKKVKASL